MADKWEEIKRLAADFQSAQLSSTAHRLSERNCIEIVNNLLAQGIVELFYTTDGKEYVTKKQLEREIRDELVVHGGRVNLVDLQQILNIDLTHIETKANEIVRGDKHLSIILGELIDKDYLDHMAEEVNESLQEVGQVLVEDVAKTFNLPHGFLIPAIEQRIGTIINGQLDPVSKDVLFTEAFITRNIAKIRGIFTAITQPTSIAQLVATYNLPEKLFFSVLESLVASNRLSGTIQGHAEKAVYIPRIYSQTQTQYIDSFFSQNGYIEFSTLGKLGIGDARSYIKKRFQDKQTLMLSSCCVGQSLIDQVNSAVNEAITNKSMVDIEVHVPSTFTPDDTSALLQHTVKSLNTQSCCHVFCDRIVASEEFVKTMKEHFRPLMQTKAEVDIKTHPVLFAELTQAEKAGVIDRESSEGKHAKRDERNKKANVGTGQKGGGGRGARESNTKKTKNKFRDRKKDNQDDEDEEISAKKSSKNEIAFMSNSQIQAILKEKLEGCDDDEFLDELSNHLTRPLTKEFQAIAKSIFLSTTSSASGGGKDKRKSHQEYQERLDGLYSNFRLFEKGIEDMEAGDGRLHLIKHLLKTIGADIVNIVFEMMAAEHLMSLGENESFTDQTRLKLLTKLPAETKGPLTKLNMDLTGKDISEFHKDLHTMLGPNHCGVQVKDKLDKKKERNLLFNHRAALNQQLQNETEPAMALHLCSLLLFQHHTGHILHAPGRSVPQIVAFLQQHVSADVHAALTDYQREVIEMVASSRKRPADPSNDEEGDEEEETDAAARKMYLADKLDDLKLIVANLKKGTAAVDNHDG